jgi:DnaJ-class molecular chaperone
MKKKVIIALIIIVIGSFIYNSMIDNFSKKNKSQQSKSYIQTNDPYVYGYDTTPTYSNSSKQIQPKKDICPTCQGSGRCIVCRGMGYTHMYGYYIACKACNGRGTGYDEDGNRYGDGVCWQCHGSGYIVH